MNNHPIYGQLPRWMQSQKKLEEKTEKINREIEEQIIDNAILAIVVNSLLLVSTILASDFFGIPEYIFTRIQEYKFQFDKSYRIGHRLESFVAIIIYIIGFFIVQLYYSFIYIFRTLSGTMFSIKDIDIQHINNIFKIKKEKNAIKSLVSIAIAACWCINLYQNIKKKETAKNIIKISNDPDIKLKQMEELEKVTDTNTNT